MPHGEYANCSKCGKVAHGHDENEVLFGYRYFGTKPQSWCRKCRSNGKNNYNDDDYDGDESEELSVGEAHKYGLLTVRTKTICLKILGILRTQQVLKT